MNLDDRLAREVSPCYVDHAFCITVARVRGLTVKRGLTLDALVARSQGGGRGGQECLHTCARQTVRYRHDALSGRDRMVRSAHRPNSGPRGETGLCVWVRGPSQGTAEVGLVGMPQVRAENVIDIPKRGMRGGRRNQWLTVGQPGAWSFEAPSSR